MTVTQLVTAAQMAAIDRRAIAGGIPSLKLMEVAGLGVVQVLADVLDGFAQRQLVVLCGKGNNGGDGFVVARHAVMQGASVQVFLAAPVDDVQGDVRVNLDRLPVPVCQLSNEFSAVRNALKKADGVVDALLGTGIRGGARGCIADVIGLLETVACPIVSVDVPSGLDADTGRINGPCVTATCTVTFAKPRLGHFFYPGRSQCGRLHVVDIGIPETAIEAENVETYLISPAMARHLLPHRAPNAHKGDCGRVAVVAGSVGLTGAAALSATAALKSGAGLVTLCVPESLNDILEAKVTEAMTKSVPEVRKARCLSLRAYGEILRLAKQADALAIGPGLGTHRETVALVRRLVCNVKVPTVIDADGLNALSGDLDAVKSCNAPLILTPHLGEFSRLTGQSIDAIKRDPAGLARRFAVNTGAVLVLKGAPTIVAMPNGKMYFNPTGNAGMATGGTGDVLTGVLVALLGQGLSVSDAACLGVYMHGLAGDLAAENIGQIGLTAGDLAASLPNAFRCVQQGHDNHRYFDFHPHFQL